MIQKKILRKKYYSLRKKKYFEIDKKFFFPLIDWEIPQAVNTIKKGLTTSDGWKEKLNILNHLLEPFTSYSKKYRDNKSIIKIMNPNNAILLMFLLFCCERNKIISIPRIKNIVCRFINNKFWFTVKDNKTPNNPRIKIRIKLSLSIEFQIIFMFISLIYLELID